MPRRPGPPSPAQLDPTPLPTLHHAREHPPATVAARVRSGEWLRVRRGVYIAAADQAASAPDAARRLALGRTLAAQGRLGGDQVISHASAALLAGLPLRAVPDRVHVTQAWRPRAAIVDDVVRHVRRLPPDHRTTVRGLPSTTLARTLADCASTLPPLDALITLDSGLHVGVDRAQVEAIVGGLAGRRGVVQARELVSLADDGAESPGETWTRWVLLSAGLPPPETQIRVATRCGDYWADLGWPQWRLVLEYDGRQKYELHAGVANAAEALLAERRRQEAIEEEGWKVIRVMKEDLRRPERLVERVVRWIPPAARYPEPRRLLLG